MINLLLLVLVVLLVAAVVIYFIGWANLPTPFDWILRLLIVVLAIAYLAQRMGVVSAF